MVKGEKGKAMREMRAEVKFKDVKTTKLWIERIGEGLC